MARMHADEVTLTDTAVQAMVGMQFPHWAGLAVKRLSGGGTSNALYRLGTDLAVRMPLVPGAAGDALKEARYLPRLAPHLPVAIPAPLAVGAPMGDYPFDWSVVPWIAGQDAYSAPPADHTQLARDLATVIAALRAIPVVDAPPQSRGGPLAPRDAAVQRCLAQLTGDIDTHAVAREWERALAAPVHDGSPVWLHADLHPGNLIVRDGRLAGVIDWGTLSAGDPATELLCAFMLDAAGRAALRDALAVDEASWQRARGWALSMAIIAWPYYRTTNPMLVAMAQHVVGVILSEN